MRIRRTLRVLGLLTLTIACSGLIAASAQAVQPENHGQQGGGPPTNPNCPDRPGNGCGEGSGNCGSNPGVGSGGQDQGFGNNESGCGSAQETDACPGDLNPGNQPAGTTCIVAQTDACPGDLNPGNQPVGTTCIVAAPTDACPDDVNPGNQPAGTTCNVAATPTDSNTTAGGDTPDQVEDDPAAQAGGVEDADDAGSAGVEGSQTGIEQAAGVTATAGGAAPTGSLPFTGLEENLLAAIGIALFLAGVALHVSARRSRRRMGAAAA